MFKAHAAAASKAGAASAAAAGGASGPGRVSLLQLTSLTRDPSSGVSSFAHSTPALSSLRSSPLLIVDVWASNVRAVFEQIAAVVDEYPYVAMDTEFPGIVARPLSTQATGGGKSSRDAYHYQTIKLNVDLLRLLQLGLCFCNEQGEVSQCVTPGPTGVPLGVVYQFHFKFSLAHDLYASDSVELLQAAGLDLDRHARDGIDVSDFAELLMTSGIVLNEEVRWLTFHAGFDFAYLLHLLIGGGQGAGEGGASSGPALPATEQEFFELIALYFPCIFDVKALVHALPASARERHPSLAVEVSHGGLDKLASTLQLARIGGQAHQAGSDALLTAACFFKVRELFFTELIPPPSVAQLQHRAQAGEGGEQQAATDASSASPATTQYHASEEQYLNHVYGLAPLANTFLRAQREKERSQTREGDEDAPSVGKDGSAAASDVRSSPVGQA